MDLECVCWKQGMDLMVFNGVCSPRGSQFELKGTAFDERRIEWGKGWMVGPENQWDGSFVSGEQMWCL